MTTLTSNQMMTSTTFELNPTIQCNDLKAFERRLMETILQQKPRERLWRIILIISLTSTAISSYFWLQDSMNPTNRLNSKNFHLKHSNNDNDDETMTKSNQQTLIELNDILINDNIAELTLLQSLARHYFFTINCIILIALFVFGIHQRVIQTNIIVNRIREVLYDFALSCDDQGKLIVKQKYSRTFSPSSSSSLMFASNYNHNYNDFNPSNPVTQVLPPNIQRRSS